MCARTSSGRVSRARRASRRCERRCNRRLLSFMHVVVCIIIELRVLMRDACVINPKYRSSKIVDVFRVASRRRIHRRGPNRPLLPRRRAPPRAVPKDGSERPRRRHRRRFATHLRYPEPRSKVDFPRARWRAARARPDAAAARCGQVIQGAIPVSYTHLRAHETREDLVWRRKV